MPDNTSILTQFLITRQRTEALCEPLQVEDYIPQPVPFASPPKWHIAHTTWFFEEMILKQWAKNYEVYNPDFSFLFNSYYNTVGSRTSRNERGVITRPGVDEVFAYRKHVDTHMGIILDGQIDKELEKVVRIGIQHEQQHQELLLTDLKYVLSLNPTNPVYHPTCNLLAHANDKNGWLAVKEGIYDIGYAGTDFCFDNELGRHRVLLPAFEISQQLVTNGEYIAFMEAGGYVDFRYWLDDGWAWVNENQISRPLYWQKIDKVWYQFTLAGLQTIDPNAILGHVSFYEALAYATWKKCRLPTEFEWEAASTQLDWGKRWEWTHSAYHPYPGFCIDEGALGEYNGKFMINQMVLRGGSVATAPGHSRPSYRNFFHPHHQWQYSGIRLAK